MGYKSSKKLYDESELSRIRNYPKVYSEEGQEKLGELVATVNYNSLITEFYYNGSINYISYFYGPSGFFKKVVYKIIGHLIQLVPLHSISSQGDELLLEVIETTKKYVTTGGSYSIHHNGNINDIKSDILEFLNRNVKDSVVVKWSDKYK